MKNTRLTKLTLYALSTLAVLGAVALFSIFDQGNLFLSIYLPLSFFTVAGIDLSQTLQDESGEVAAYQCCGLNRPGVYVDEFGFLRVAAIGQNPPAQCTRTGGSSFADRFLAYLFIAPFIAPARLHMQVTSR
jgi:hypothetical protein